MQEAAKKSPEQIKKFSNLSQRLFILSQSIFCDPGLPNLISRVFLKSRIIYMFYNRLFLQPVRDLDGILLGPLHADSESLDAS